MICKECGAKIADTSTVCEFCGAVYGENAPAQAEEITQAATEPEVTEESAPQAVVEPDEAERIFDENEAKRRLQMEKIRQEKQIKLDEIEKRRRNKKRKQNRNRVLAVILALLCGGAIGLGAYYVSLSGDDTDDIVIVTPRPTVAVTPSAEVSPTPVATITPEPIETVRPAQTSAPVATAKPAATAKPQTVKPAATAKPQAVSNVLKPQLVTGGEVVKSGNDTYMSFTMNGQLAYTKVSDNTTTEFISGKPMTLALTKTGDKFNGKPLYKLNSITHYNGNYILKNSGTALLTEADLAGMSKEKLRLARNEIYARHGRAFSDSTLQSYFDSCSWYKKNSAYNYSSDSKNLNPTEKRNAQFIMDYEAKLQ